MRFDGLVKSWRTVIKTGSTTIANLFATLFGGVFYGAATGGVLTTLTYGPTIALDASLGNEFVFTITDNVAFVLSNPTNPPPSGQDQIILVTYQNTSGAAHGAGTFGTLYKVSNANFAAVATGFQRTIAFRWDGTNWVEIWRTAADVAV